MTEESLMFVLCSLLCCIIIRVDLSAILCIQNSRPKRHFEIIKPQLQNCHRFGSSWVGSDRVHPKVGGYCRGWLGWSLLDLDSEFGRVGSRNVDQCTSLRTQVSSCINPTKSVVMKFQASVQ